MNNYALYKYTAQQLLDEALNGDDLIYEEDALTLVGASLITVHHQITKAEAKAIMHRIVQDDVICEALRSGIQYARSNPDGDMPVDGAHPIDPAVALVKERAILPILGALPPVPVTLGFVSMAYEYVEEIEQSRSHPS